MKLKGILITNSGKPFIRQYTPDGEFRDIEILNADLSIEIDDAGAQLRQDKNGDWYIDYDDATLGYTNGSV